jgi:hypothetical protein
MFECQLLPAPHQQFSKFTATARTVHLLLQQPAQLLGGNRHRANKLLAMLLLLLLLLLWLLVLHSLTDGTAAAATAAAAVEKAGWGLQPVEVLFLLLLVLML